MKKKTNKKMENGKQEVSHSNRENSIREKEEAKIVGAGCNDKKCHIHSGLKVRGRIFEGRVTKKFKNRVTIEFERMIYSKKYERYFRAKTKIHAHLASCMESEIQIGDLIRIQECRPLSKIIHFVVIKKIKGKGER
jgi:small subunit ribosomal protein S17